MYNCICLCKFVDFSIFSRKLSYSKAKMRLLSEGAGARFLLCNYFIRTSF